MTAKTDTQINKDVLDELAYDPSINKSKIAVAVSNGVVTLSGSVPNYFEKWNAESAVKRVNGVEGVAEELKVEPFAGMEYGDSEIANAARQAIKWHGTGSDKDIQIRVENGWITLEGHTPWQYQRTSFYDAVAYMRGVKGVTNLIAVKPAVVPTDIKGQIEAAFKRRAGLDAQQVRIEIDGGKVTLKGKLPTWAERAEAETVVWNAAGVATVNNQISVGL